MLDSNFYYSYISLVTHARLNVAHNCKRSAKISPPENTRARCIFREFRVESYQTLRDRFGFLVSNQKDQEHETPSEKGENVFYHEKPAKIIDF